MLVKIHSLQKMTNPVSKIARFKRKLEDTTQDSQKKKQKIEKDDVLKNRKEPVTNLTLSDNDFIQVATEMPHSLKNKVIRTYSKAEKMRRRKRPEEEEKERKEVLTKFKNSSNAMAQKGGNSLQLLSMETTDGIEKFVAEAQKTLSVSNVYHVLLTNNYRMKNQSPFQS